MKRILIAAIAAVLFASSPALAQVVPTPEPTVPPGINTTSPVTITDAHVWQSHNRWDQCFSFVNNSDKTATAIEVVFANHNPFELLNDFTFSRGGLFAPHVEINGANTLALATDPELQVSRNCFYDYAIMDDVTEVDVYVVAVHFQDGSTWRNTANMPPPDYRVNFSQP